MPSRLTATVIAVLLAIGSQHANADFRADYRGDGGLQSIEVGHGKVRFATAHGHGVIFDAAQKALILLDSDKHEFTRMDEATVDALGETVSGAMAQMDAALAKLPPEQRALVMARMPKQAQAVAGPKPLVSIKATGASDSVAGFRCEIFRIDIDGDNGGENCLANAADLGLGADDIAAFRQSADFARHVGEKIAGGRFNTGLDYNMFNGEKLPVRIKSKNGSSALTAVSKAAIAQSEFDIPSDYHERKIEVPKLPARH
ncbi:MAG: DUF4412 domain-containing protein [Tahibacter sp.]